MMLPKPTNDGSVPGAPGLPVQRETSQEKQFMFSKRIGGLLAGLLALVIVLSTGCTVDPMSAARGSLTSFFNTMATSAIENAINQP